MTPVEDFFYLVNSVLLGEEPTVEDFILLIGTCVAFIAFVLWCCFPITPKDPGLAPSHSHAHCAVHPDTDREHYTYVYPSPSDREYFTD